MEKCTELIRFERAEERVDELREDIQEIREGFTALTSEIHTIGLDIRSHTEMINSFIRSVAERDRVTEQYRQEQKETFQRFGNKIDGLDERVRQTEADRQQAAVLAAKVALLEKINWSAAAGIGMLVLFYIQQRIN